MQDESNVAANALAKDLSATVLQLQTTMVQRDQKYEQDSTMHHQRASDTAQSSLQRDEMVWNEQIHHKQKIIDLQLQLLQQQQSIELLERSLPRNAHVKMEDVSQPSALPGPSSYMGECDRGKGVPREMPPCTIILKL